jgi:threonine aldolase
MRFISAQFSAFFKNDLWLKLATHSNAMAALLHEELLKISEISITRPVEVNAVFCIMPAEVAQRMQTKFPFYTWNEQTEEVRLMCSWDTREQDIHEFIEALKQELMK